MSPQTKQTYISVKTCEEESLSAEASRHDSTAEIDLESSSSSSSLTTTHDDSASCPTTSTTFCTTIITDYIHSYRAAELICSLTFFLITNTSGSWLDVSPQQRIIPVQYLESSGEYVKNLTHDQEFDGETVPWLVLILLSGVAPLVLQVVLSLFFRQSSSSCCPITHEVHQTLCVYFVAWSLNMIAVEFVKNYVGYLRPLFFQSCQPNDDYSACTNDGNSLRKSFPSGHAATAFCGMTLLALYIHYRFGVYSQRQYRQVFLHQNNNENGDKTTGDMQLQLVYKQDGLPLARLCSLIALVPLLVALWIAASRVRDNKHFPADVLAGALIGSSLARFTHSLWFV